MASWPELRAALSRGTTVVEKDWQLEIASSGIRVTQRKVFGEVWVEIFADICDHELIPAGDALAYNRTTAFGAALLLNKRRYQLRVALPLPGTSEELFLDVFAAVGVEAERLRGRLRPTRAMGDLFAPYGD